MHLIKPLGVTISLQEIQRVKGDVKSHQGDAICKIQMVRDSTGQMTTYERQGKERKETVTDPGDIDKC